MPGDEVHFGRRCNIGRHPNTRWPARVHHWITRRRELRIGLFGGHFCNLSPLVRADIQSRLLMHNPFDLMTEADPGSRQVVPLAVES